MMTQPSLFSYDDVALPDDLQRLQEVLAVLPDEPIIAALKARRGRGRDDFPVAAMWRAVFAGIVFQHGSIASLIRELNRNPALLDICGFEPFKRAKKPRIVRDPHSNVVRLHISKARLPIPADYNFTRFLSSVIAVEEESGLVSAMLLELRHRLMAALPDFGCRQGCDGKAVASHSTGQRNTATGRTSDPDATWGKHETHGVCARTGRPWEKVKEWFGYTLHVIADTKYEIPVAVTVTPASASEVVTLEGMLQALYTETPEMAERCRFFTADRGYDSGSLKARLWDAWRIRPIIDTRRLWRAEKKDPGYDTSKPITRLLDPDRADTIVATEQGALHCICPDTDTQRDLAFHGFEEKRGTLKYRCPAAAYGIHCQGRTKCEAQSGCRTKGFGRVIRVPLDSDRRRFMPTPHGSLTWKREYNARAALERINSRIDQGYGFENHYIRGLAKMTMKVNLSMAVMMALALASLDQPTRMRSLLRRAVVPDSG